MSGVLIMLAAFALTAPPSCDEALVSSEPLLAKYTAPEIRMQLASELLRKHCKDTLPAPILEGLRVLEGDLTLSPKLTGARAVEKVVRAAPKLWDRVCRSGREVFRKAAIADDFGGQLFDQCGWEKGLPLGTREEVARSAAPAMAAVVLDALQREAGVSLERARRYARAVGGFEQIPARAE